MKVTADIENRDLGNMSSKNKTNGLLNTSYSSTNGEEGKENPEKQKPGFVKPLQGSRKSPLVAAPSVGVNLVHLLHGDPANQNGSHETNEEFTPKSSLNKSPKVDKSDRNCDYANIRSSEAIQEAQPKLVHSSSTSTFSELSNPASSSAISSILSNPSSTSISSALTSSPAFIVEVDRSDRFQVS